MSLSELKRLLRKHDKQTRVKVVEHFTSWMKNKTNIASLQHRTIEKKRKQIPKLIRGKVWEMYHGDSLKGECYCCARELDAFDAWHVGHIVSHANGGADVPSNLRPLCASCNTSMGPQNMDEFKAEYYPDINKISSKQPSQ